MAQGRREARSKKTAYDTWLDALKSGRLVCMRDKPKNVFRLNGVYSDGISIVLPNGIRNISFTEVDRFVKFFGENDESGNKVPEESDSVGDDGDQPEVSE